MTSRETVPNRALSGTELKRLILADTQAMLDGDGLLSPYIAYGRVSYSVTVRLHMDNPLTPESSTTRTSRTQATGAVAADSTLAAVEPAPLAGASDAAVVSATRRTRTIDSPNAERLRTGLPVPVEVKQSDGTTHTETIQYPPDPSLGDRTARDEDVTAETSADWKISAKPTASAIAPPDLFVGSAPAWSDPLLARLCHCGYPRGLHALSGLSTQPPLNGRVCTGFADAMIPRPVDVKQAWPVPAGS